MGTRSDFYVGKGKDAKWLGSAAWDGDPYSMEEDGILSPTTEPLFVAAVIKMLEARDDATNPSQGWPWPWEDSCTTDFAYCFVNDHVEIFDFGHPYQWPRPELSDEEMEKFAEEESNQPKAEFPNMKSIQKVDLGARSGLMIFKTK